MSADRCNFGIKGKRRRSHWSSDFTGTESCRVLPVRGVSLYSFCRLPSCSSASKNIYTLIGLLLGILTHTYLFVSCRLVAVTPPHVTPSSNSACRWVGGQLATLLYTYQLVPASMSLFHFLSLLPSHYFISTRQFLCCRINTYKEIRSFTHSTSSFCDILEVSGSLSWKPVCLHDLSWEFK